MEITLTTILLCSVIVLFAFYVRSLVGFAGALIAVPLFALFFDLKFIVPLQTIFEILASIFLLKSIFKYIKWKDIVPLLVGSFLGTIFGVFILRTFANDVLKKALGIIVILFATYMFIKNTEMHKKLRAIWGYISGAVAGVLGGAFATPGPAYVFYLTHHLKSKQVIRACLIAVFAIDHVWRLVLFGFGGLVSVDTLKFSAFLIPALALGTYLGHVSHFSIGEKSYRQIISIILFISGILLLVR